MLDADVTDTPGAFGRLGAWLRGDRYMVGAYAPRPEAIPRAAADERVVEQDAATVHDR